MAAFFGQWKKYFAEDSVETFDFKYATWNTGTPRDFYFSLMKYIDPTSRANFLTQMFLEGCSQEQIKGEFLKMDVFKDLSDEFRKALEKGNIPDDLLENEHRRLIIQRLTEIDADVVCLQELHRDHINHKDFQTFLAKRGYQIETDGRDPAVMFRINMFKMVHTQKVPSQYMMVGLQSRQIQEVRILVTSAHVTGFKLSEANCNFGTSDREYRTGDKELYGCMNVQATKLNEGNWSAAIFGADMNTSEVVKTDSQVQRIDIPSEYNFQRESLDNDGKTTSFNRCLGEAQLDHVYSLGVSKTITFDLEELSPRILPPSDHKPVIGYFHIKL